jgi:hypothetical protein
LAGGESGGRASGDGWRFAAARNPEVGQVGGRFAAAWNPDVGRAGAGAVYGEHLIVSRDICCVPVKIHDFLGYLVHY